MLVCISALVARDAPDNPSEKITVLAKKKGLTVVLSSDDMPLALFKWRQNVFIGMPDDVDITLPKTLPRGYKLSWIKNVKGGKLLSVAVPPAVFPAFRAAATQKAAPLKTRIVLTEKPLSVELEPSLVYPDVFQQQTARTIGIQTNSYQTLSFKLVGSDKRYAVLLTRNKGKGLAVQVRQKEWRALPTQQGLFFQLLSPDVSVNAAALVHKKKFAKPFHLKKASATPTYDLAMLLMPQAKPKNFGDLKQVGTMPYLFAKAKRLLFQKKYHATLQALQKLEVLNGSMALSEDFNALKGIALAFLGRKAEAMAAFATSKGLLRASMPFHALLYARNRDFSKTLSVLNSFFPSITRLPQPFKGDLLLLGAQSALVMGAPKKRALFLHTLKKDTLSAAQQSFLGLLQAPPSSQTKSDIASGFWLSDTIVSNPFWLAYHQQVAQKYQNILLKMNHRTLGLDQAILKLEMVAQEGRGGTIEAEVLQSLAKLYEKKHNLVKALDTYRRFFRYAPPMHPLRAFLRQHAQKLYIKGLYQKEWSAFKRCAFFKRFQSFLPKGVKGDEIITTFALMFADNGLTDHIVPILTAAHFTNPGKKADLLLHCVGYYFKQDESAKALELLHKSTPPGSHKLLWRRYRALALARLDRPQEALDLLEEFPNTVTEAEIVLPAFVEMKKWNKALKVIEFLLKETKSPEYLDMLASLLQTRGDLPYIKHIMRQLNVAPTSFVKTLLDSKKIALPTTQKALNKALDANKDFRADVQKMLAS